MRQEGAPGRPGCGWRGRSGLTLVEVLVAMALLVIIVATAMAALYQVAHASQMVRLRTAAATLAWNRVERARQMAFDEIDDLIEPAPGNVVDANGLLDVDGLLRRQTTVETATNSYPMKHVRVDVWPRNPRSSAFEEKSECMETIITELPHR